MSLQLKDFDKNEIKEIAGTISLLMKAIDGSPIEPDDIIRELINLKDIRERSRFPTYPILAKNVYLRLIAKYHPEAEACLEYAHQEAHSLISYKGESRKEAVEMRKAPQPTGQDQTIMYHSPMQPAQPKRRFWQRKQKIETEFSNQ